MKNLINNNDSSDNQNSILGILPLGTQTINDFIEQFDQPQNKDASKLGANRMQKEEQTHEARNLHHIQPNFAKTLHDESRALFEQSFARFLNKLPIHNGIENRESLNQLDKTQIVQINNTDLENEVLFVLQPSEENRSNSAQLNKPINKLSESNVSKLPISLFQEESWREISSKFTAIYTSKSEDLHQFKAPRDVVDSTKLFDLRQSTFVKETEPNVKIVKEWIGLVVEITKKTIHMELKDKYDTNRVATETGKLPINKVTKADQKKLMVGSIIDIKIGIKHFPNRIQEEFLVTKVREVPRITPKQMRQALNRVSMRRKGSKWNDRT